MNLTLEDVASYTNLSTGYISRLENNTSTPSYETLLKLSKTLYFNLGDVIGEVIDDSIQKKFDIIEVLSMFNLKINDSDLSSNEKYILGNIIKLIYDLDWENESEKIHGIIKLLDFIGAIKNISKK